MFELTKRRPNLVTNSNIVFELKEESMDFSWIPDSHSCNRASAAYCKVVNLYKNVIISCMCNDKPIPSFKDFYLKAVDRGECKKLKGIYKYFSDQTKI